MRRSLPMCTVLLFMGFLGIGVIGYWYGVSHSATHHVVLMEKIGKDAFRIDTQPELAYWKKRIQKVGDAAAYGELSKSIEKFTLPLQHRAAHIFGEALYRSEGIAGVLVCREEYGQGCRHSFFGLAMNEHGIELGTTKLAAICATEKTSSHKRRCEHAIGHGFISYAGYTLDSLTKALESCKKIITKSDFTIGCAGGAFMEYNLRALLRSDNVGPRELTHLNRYGPCTELPTQYQSSCIFWQPEWWLSVLSMSKVATTTEEALQMIGQFCDTSPFGNEARRACFRGMGYMTAWVVNLDSERAARVCTDASSLLKDRLECWWYTAGQLPRDTAERYSSLLCADQDGASYTYCVAHKMDMASFDTGINPILQNEL